LATARRLGIAREIAQSALMTTRLVSRGSEPASVFGLLGADENAATFALGWALANSQTLAESLFSHLGLKVGSDDILVELQRHGEHDRGYTDIELRSSTRFHIVIEAKHGWDPPSQEQLTRYAGRLQGSAERRLVSLSAAAASYASLLLPSAVAGVPVSHLSWGELRRLVQQAGAAASGWRERLWLNELNQHLGGYVADQRTDSNLVYVVSLSRNELVPGYSWIDVVEQTDSYFHPYGAGTGWPVTPPNYLGFRYDGQLQTVRHVDSHEVMPALGSADPRWAAVEGTHILYRLGRPMRPAREVRTGNIFRAARVSCAIDTLLSGQYETISSAREETARRRNEQS